MCEGNYEVNKQVLIMVYFRVSKVYVRLVCYNTSGAANICVYTILHKYNMESNNDSSVIINRNKYLGPSSHSFFFPSIFYVPVQ